MRFRNKLIHKIYLWAKSKLKEDYLRRMGNDIKCPNCKEWASITSLTGENKRELVQLPLMTGVEKRTCGQCGEVSYWVWGIIPGYSRVSEKGEVL